MFKNGLGDLRWPAVLNGERGVICRRALHSIQSFPRPKKGHFWHTKFFLPSFETGQVFTVVKSAKIGAYFL